MLAGRKMFAIPIQMQGSFRVRMKTAGKTDLWQSDSLKINHKAERKPKDETQENQATVTLELSPRLKLHV